MKDAQNAYDIKCFELNSINHFRKNSFRTSLLFQIQNNVFIS